MAQKVQFLGFKRVLTGTTMAENYLYFVRANGSAVEGELWFNNVCYGKCRDTEINDIQRALDGFLSGDAASGTTVKEYIDEAVSAITSGMTTSVEKDPNAFSGLTIEDKSTTPNVKDYVVNLQNVAPADELAAEIDAREDADEAIQSELDAVEEAVGLSSAGTHVQSSGRFTSAATTVEAEIAALDAALQNVADQTIVEGSSTEDYVKLDVATEDGVTTISINDSALTAAIEAMDLAEVHEAGKAIVAVSEEDGVVSATAGTVAAEYVDVADAAGKFTGSTVEEVLAEIDAAYKAADAAIVGDATESGNTLGKLEDRIEALDADAKEYHIVKTTTGLPETIKERYELQDASGNTSGATIDIPKDSHIVSINYITSGEHAQNLEYVYIDACGNTQTTYVDMSELVLETEFASGVGVTNHIAHGVVDPQSEAFLTVGADGFKLSGVQDAIDAAKTAATAYTQSEIEKLDYTDTAATGQYVTEVNEADGVISVSRANVSEAVLNNYAKGSDATAVAATDTVNKAISKLENQVDAAKAAATTKVEKDNEAIHLTLTSSTAADGSVTYTIGEDDIASASALTKEISDREAADAAIQAELDAVESSLGFDGTCYTNTGVYITGDTVADDIKRLDTALNGVEDNFIEALEKEIDDRTSADTAIRESLAETAQTLSDAIEDEASARTAADEALDVRLDVVEEKYITGATVNGVNATVTDHVADVTIQADDIELGEEVTGTTGGIHFDATANTQDVFQSIVDVLNQSVAGSYTGVTSNDGSIIPTSQTNGQDLSVNTKTLQLADAQAGETEVKKDESTGALYGVMYWIDEETA